MPDLSTLDWTLLALAAALVGAAKTALPGAGTISVALFAAVLPAKASTGALLLLLILGDLFAVRTHHAHADWGVLRRLAPAVLVGVLAGTVFLRLVDDASVRRVIGVILVAMIALTVLRRWAAVPRASGRGRRRTPAQLTPPDGPGAAGAAPGGRRPWRRRAESGTYGVLGGFTTMVANSAGPVMSMYFLAGNFSMHRFLGTSAWFFLAVNLAKTPFSVSLGLITAQSLLLDLVLAPLVVLGALVGGRLVRHINQKLFERAVVVLTLVSATYLIL
ncbi:sulfite exporter TauE/SafE family protein [Georgenia sp. SYP-B2076]|uniref:sulfite exporter TauE/SafE family protein n=1 Tax=Georgenia sp. SYP-B2076 TaxID=2495881 RepID=UPI001F0CC5C0|nr:sulfite exporter TauE/SafE family protein [Georgenia sp. SYP-B2076]